MSLRLSVCLSAFMSFSMPALNISSRALTSPATPPPPNLLRFSFLFHSICSLVNTTSFISVSLQFYPVCRLHPAFHSVCVTKYIPFFLYQPIYSFLPGLRDLLFYMNTSFTQAIRCLLLHGLDTVSFSPNHSRVPSSIK